MNVPEVRLTGRALRFLYMMQEFGHVSDINRILVDLPHFGPPGPDGVYDLDVIRRAVAQGLLDDRPEGLTGVLAEDWPILFS